MTSGEGAPDQGGPDSGAVEEPIDLVAAEAEGDDEDVFDLEMLAWNLGAILDDRGRLLPVSLLDFLR